MRQHARKLYHQNDQEEEQKRKRDWVNLKNASS